MVAKEALQVEENTDLSQDLYEEEETLSLCDLPIHNDSSKWDVESSSIDDNDKDGFFEFFSEDFTASTYPSSGKDIIFCGKLIPYKEVPPLLPHDHHKKTQNNLDANKKKLPTKKGFQLWKSYSFHNLVRSSSSSNSKGSKIGKNSNSKPQQAVKANSMNNNCVYNTSKISSDDHHQHRRHLSVGKVSVLSSPTKSSKWYFYMFGIAKLQTEMELKDIKTRQSRRSPSTMFASPEKISTETVKEKVVRRRSGKGLWGFLRALGCRNTTSQHPNGVEKGSSGCNIPELCDS